MDATPPSSPPSGKQRPGLRAQIVVLVVAALVAGLGAVMWSRAAADRRGRDDEVMFIEPGEFIDPSMTNPNVEREPFPSVQVATAHGERITLAPDDRPMVVNLWFSTCGPCALELPYFATVEQEYRDQVRFVGVNPQDSPERMNSFAAERGVEYELLLDDEHQLLDALRVLSFPVTLFVSPDGEIVAQRGEVSEAELRAGVQALLAA